MADPSRSSIRDLNGWVESWRRPPELSVCIPSRDRLDLLVPCLTALAGTSHGRAVEVVIGDTGSSAATHDFYAAIGVPTVDAPPPFNYSRVCNRLARAARADRLLFLNNDTQAVTVDWLDRLLTTSPGELAGATLVYPTTSRVQHAGVEVIPVGGWLRPNSYRPPRAHRKDFPLALAHIGVGRRLEGSSGSGGLRGSGRRGQGAAWGSGAMPTSGGPENRRAVPVMAVTGAFLYTSREQFTAAGGFDEAYEVDLQDTDYCLRCRQLGYEVVCRRDIVFAHRHAGTRGRYAFPLCDWRTFAGRWQDELMAWQVAPNPGGRSLEGSTCRCFDFPEASGDASTMGSTWLAA